MQVDIRHRLIALVLATTALAGVAAPVPHKQLAHETAIARDYVLASCLIKRYPGTSVAADAEVWAQALIERGDVSADSYARLAHLADTEAVAVSRGGTPVPLLDCMTLYNSRELPASIARAIQR